MFHLLILNNVPILEQLQLEEALLRTTHENWCILNTGAPPAIVMGISGKPEKLLDLNRIKKDQIPIIKRFSGGGTVYIDPETIFITWICNHSTFSIPLQPQPILQWSETLYQPLFTGFSLKENDYVFGEKKFGGNALYIQRSRWLLHTSLLWNYDPEKMSYLLLPEKAPQYRKSRSHQQFLCTLNEFYPSKEELVNQLASHIAKTYPIQLTSHNQIRTLPFPPHRKATSELFLSL
jgi:lipoate-protein ligase A